MALLEIIPSPMLQSCRANSHSIEYEDMWPMKLGLVHLISFPLRLHPVRAQVSSTHCQRMLSVVCVRRFSKETLCSGAFLVTWTIQYYCDGRFCPERDEREVHSSIFLHAIWKAQGCSQTAYGRFSQI